MRYTIANHFLILTFVVALMLTACTASKNDELPQKQFSSLSVKYSLITDGDFLKVFDATVQYRDKAGQIQTETVTTNDFNIAFSVTTLPYTAGVKFSFKLKDNLDQQAKYTFHRSFVSSYNATFSDNSTQAFPKSELAQYNIGISYDGLKKVLETLNSTCSQADVFSLNGDQIVKNSVVLDF